MNIVMLAWFGFVIWMTQFWVWMISFFLVSSLFLVVTFILVVRMLFTLRAIQRRNLKLTQRSRFDRSSLLIWSSFDGVFLCFSGNCYFSSYVDDIAFIKILCQQGLMWHAQLQGHGVNVLFFCRVVWIFYRFRLVFLAVGIFL